MEEMGKKKGKLLAAGVISMILLLIAGCSEKKQEPELKQALKPQFGSGGIRSVSLKKGGEDGENKNREIRKKLLHTLGRCGILPRHYAWECGSSARCPAKAGLAGDMMPPEE